jgi:MFS family permease
VLKLALFARPVFALSNLAALVNYSATFAVTFLLSIYLQTVRSLPVRAAGLLLLVQPVLMAILSPLAGRLSDRVEPRIVASVGMALTSAGLLVAARLGAASHLGGLVAALVLLGVGFGLFSSPNTNAVMSAVAKADYGVASATLGTMRVVGQALSMAFVALVTALHLGHAPLAPAAAPQLIAAQHTALTVFAALCALGVAASLARGRMHSKGVRSLRGW